MGFIPIFLTLGGACLLFFLTVRNTFQRKIALEKELFFNLGEKLPELNGKSEELTSSEQILKQISGLELSPKTKKEVLELLRDMKVNRSQYNKLIKKAPYNWVAKISGFRPI